MQKEHPILKKDIELLATSDEFRLMAEQNEFKNLGDIADHPVSELMKRPGMNYRMWRNWGKSSKDSI